MLFICFQQVSSRPPMKKSLQKTFADKALIPLPSDNLKEQSSMELEGKSRRKHLVLRPCRPQRALHALRALPDGHCFTWSAS